MQGDARSLASAEILPALRALEPSSDLERQAVELLRSWDGVVGAESGAAAVYEVLSWRLAWIVFGEKLGALAPHVIGQGLTDLNPANPFLWHTARLLRQRAARDPEWGWFDDPSTAQVETAGDLLPRALAEAVAYLRQELGSDPAEWSWGKIHAIRFQNLLSRSSPVESLFHLTRGPYPIGGTPTPSSRPHSCPGTRMARWAGFRPTGWSSTWTIRESRSSGTRRGNPSTQEPPLRRPDPGLARDPSPKGRGRPGPGRAPRGLPAGRVPSSVSFQPAAQASSQWVLEDGSCGGTSPLRSRARDAGC